MTTSSAGCGRCRAELFGADFTRIQFLGKSHELAVKVYRCDACGTWYKWTLSDRMFVINDGEARDLLAQIDKENRDAL